MKNGTQSSTRLLSIDVLRGFDMLFIMGFADLVCLLCELFPGGEHFWLAEQMEHVSWNGLAHHDTIFPLFLFISGMTFPFSYARKMQNGAGKGRVLCDVLRRAAILVVLGLVYNGLFKLELATLRFPSVLARIGLAWMFAALLYIYVPKISTRALIAATILVAYWVLHFFTAPDAPVGTDPVSAEGSLVGYVDRCLIPNHIYEKGFFDPEGILSTLPAIVTAMLGMFTGEFVRIPQEKISGNKKTIYMFAAAAILLAAGLAWSIWFPVNKKLWTSSFVLVVGAYSVAMFALFYWIIDVKGWKGWTGFFKVIGMNSIIIYLAQRIIDFNGIRSSFSGDLAGQAPNNVGAIILKVSYIAVCWLFLYVLYRKKIFLKV